MAFRSILISEATKINLDLNNIVIQYSEDKFHVNLDEISTLVLDDPRCLVSLKLLSELCERGINVVFTDGSHKPVGSLTTLYNNVRAPKKNKLQINWDNNLKGYLWTSIVKNKIINQREVLKRLNKTDKIDILNDYIQSIEYGDCTNREGLASRTYFKELFGISFKRFNEDIINYCLNFSYQIIRSKISQEIVALGYQPSFGICHKSEYNTFNLADDFIEVFRPIIDDFVLNNCVNKERFSREDRLNLIKLSTKNMLYHNQTNTFLNVINMYISEILEKITTNKIEEIEIPLFRNYNV